MEGTPLLDVMRGLILEPEAQAEFAADPSGYMQRFGYDDVPEDDLREAVDLVADTLPPDVAHAVTTAAAADPSDDAFGEGTVGLLGRISTAEVTESVVPDLGPLPEESPDEGGVADEGAGDHDATAFGDVTQDFDDDEAVDAAADEPEALDDAVDETGEVDEAVAEAGADAATSDHPLRDAENALDDADDDVSFGEGGADDVTAADAGADPFSSVEDEAEAFGQGSGADADAPALPDDAEAADPADPDDFDSDAAFAPQPDGGFDDLDEMEHLGDLVVADDELDAAEDTGDPGALDDGDVGTF